MAKAILLFSIKIFLSSFRKIGGITLRAISSFNKVMLSTIFCLSTAVEKAFLKFLLLNGNSLTLKDKKLNPPIGTTLASFLFAIFSRVSELSGDRNELKKSI